MSNLSNIMDDLIKQVEKDNFFNQTTDKLKEENNHLRNKINILQNMLNDIKKQKIEMEVKNELEIKSKNQNEINLFDNNGPVRLLVQENNSTVEVYQNEEDKKIPDIVFIVPYRDRGPQRKAFICVMKSILEGMNCLVYFSHQRDSRPFNRGAIKNLGFLYIKNKYPEHYKKITFVFHDIDYMPWYKNQFSYKTTNGVINHFYGFKRALGGIFAIKGEDFEDANGFPNYWSWGLEDNMLKWRLEQLNKKIIYPDFISSEKNNKNIIGLWHGWERVVNNNLEYKARYKMHEMKDGLSSIYNIRYDELHMEGIFGEININSFETGENKNSPYVRGLVSQDARKSIKLNAYARGPRRRSYKIGTAGTFGKRAGFGGMIL